jgi:hypothetical protein
MIGIAKQNAHSHTIGSFRTKDLYRFGVPLRKEQTGIGKQGDFFLCAN